jgi:hypothetical protein
VKGVALVVRVALKEQLIVALVEAFVHKAVD